MLSREKVSDLVGKPFEQTKNGYAFYDPYYLLDNEILYIEGYKVNCKGDILSLKSNKILKWVLDKDGYAKVTIPLKGKRRNLSVHKIVGTTFKLEECRHLIDKGIKIVFDHIDRNKTNNLMTNIRPTTVQENVLNISDKALENRKLNMLKNRSISHSYKPVMVDGKSFKSLHSAALYISSKGITSSVENICKNLSQSLTHGYKKCYGFEVKYLRG